jgi:hypothetical protein
LRRQATVGALPLITMGVARAKVAVRRRWPILLIAALAFTSASFAGLWLAGAGAGTKRSSVFTFHNVKISKFDSAENSPGSNCTVGDDWQDVPDSALTFKIGHATSVLVDVSAVVDASAIGQIQLLIDGTAQGIGPMSWDSGTSSLRTTSSYLDQTSVLSPGEHTAALRYVADTAESFCIVHWTYAVLHS